MATDAVKFQDRIRAFLLAAQTRRVDWVGVGDSNQYFGGTTGHHQGMEVALHQRVMPIYASGVLPLAGDNLSGWSANRNDIWAHALGAGGWNASATPTFFDDRAFANGAGFSARTRAYLADSESISAGSTHYQIGIKPGALLDITAELNWTFTYGTFSSGAGTFRPSVRRNASLGFQADGGAIDPVTGTEALVDYSLTIPKNLSRDFEINGELFRVLSGTNLEGPFFGSYQRVEQPGRTAGVAYTTLLYQGGQSARNAAISLKAQTETAMEEWIRQVVRLQTGDPMMLIQVKHSGNDRNDSNQSEGPNPASSDTPEGYKDNLHAIYMEIMAAWLSLGYQPQNLFFVFGAYHPQQGNQTIGSTTKSKEQWNIDFHDAASELADEVGNASVVYGPMLISSAQMDANGWYGSGGDAHLTQAGYEGFGALEADALLVPRTRRKSAAMIPSMIG